jgi:membrane protein implicated in regulation of membrane protease activity
MKFNKRNAANIFLVLGIVFLIVGISTDNTAFSWVSVAFIIISLVLGGRWFRQRKR